MQIMSTGDTTRMTLLIRLRDRADQLSWQEFHDRYSQLLFRYARGRGASHEDAEDVAQEVEMYLFKAMEGFEYDATKGRFRAYLRSAVVHALGRRAQKAAKQGPLLDPQNFDFLAASEDAGRDDAWEREWKLNRLRWAMRSIAGEMEEKTVRAFELHVLGGLSVDETAEQVEFSKASVYQAKSRVLKRLKERLAEIDPDGDL